MFNNAAENIWPTYHCTFLPPFRIIGRLDGVPSAYSLNSFYC